MTATAGFLFASRRSIDPALLLATVGGIALVIASGCVVNNYIDRGIDKKMKRTKNRALVTGAISPVAALIFATLLAGAGFSLLALYVNALAVYLGVIALFSYLVLYGIAKRKSVHGTLVGTIPGAMPLLAGYCAVTGSFDEVAVILLLIMVAWQMPHFYAIAIYRSEEYKRAGIPVLPLVKGIGETKLQMIVYIGLFIITTLTLGVRGHAGLIYTIGIGIIGLRWLQLALKGLKAEDTSKWARKLFGFSLIVLLTLSALLSVDAWLV